jgi:hypothetical protein
MMGIHIKDCVSCGRTNGEVNKDNIFTDAMQFKGYIC